MIDFDSIWRTQDEIRTVVNAVLGECIWNLAYDITLAPLSGIGAGLCFATGAGAGLFILLFFICKGTHYSFFFVYLQPNL